MKTLITQKHRYIWFGIAILTAWTLIACAWTPPTFFLEHERYHVSALFVFTSVFLAFVPWMLVTPAILYLGRAFPIARPDLSKHTTIQAAAGIMLIPAVTVLGTTLTHAILTVPKAAGGGTASQLTASLITAFYSVPTYVAVVGIGQAVAYFQRYRDRERLLAQAQLRALKAQMNPHFLFNTLNAVGMLGYRDAKRADLALSRLSELLRLALAETNQEVCLREEIAFVSSYTDVYTLVHHDRLHLRLEIAPQVWRAAVPSMLLQPLVENAVVHGIAKRHSGGDIVLSAQQFDKRLELSVLNDGISHGREEHRNGLGIGLKNTDERLRALYDSDYRLDILQIGSEQTQVCLSRSTTMNKISMVSFTLLAWSLPSFAATLHVTPRTALYDQPVKIRITNLKPAELVTLQLRAKDNKGRVWKSHASYHANLGGVLDLAQTSPLHGSYSTADPMGLFWSMQPPQGVQTYFHVAGKKNSKTGRPQSRTYQLKATADGRPIDTVKLTRQSIAPNVEIKHIRDGAFIADLYFPKGTITDGRHHPALIALGGAGGGIRAADQFGAWLASHGFVTLALAWYHIPPLPKNMVHVPVKPVEQAVDYLQKQSFVNPQSIGVIGASWGGTLALFTAAHLPRIHAVVSWMGTPVVGAGLKRGISQADYKPANESPFLYKGKPVPFVTYTTLLKFFHTQNQSLLNKAFIPIEQINAPVRFVAGGDDKLAASGVLASLAMQRLQRKHHPYMDKVFYYPEAGHLIWPGYLPTANRAGSNKSIPVGGTSESYARADADIGPKVLAFLRHALGEVR